MNWSWTTVAIVSVVVLAAAYWYYSQPAGPSAAGTDSASSDTSASTSADTSSAPAYPNKTMSNFNYAGCDGSYTYDPASGAYMGGTAESPRTLHIDGSRVECITQAGQGMGIRTIVSGTPGDGEVNFN